MSYIINIGYGNMVNADRIIGIIKPDAAPVKRMVQHAKDNGTAIDATCGRKTKSVIITDDNSLVLSALLPDTIAQRINNNDIFRGDSND